MDEFDLKIFINEKHVKQINESDQKVVILKDSDGGLKKTVWIAFSPFQYNHITWKEDYSVYASMNEIEEGGIIEKNSEKLAIPQYIYSFANGVFDDGTKDEKNLSENQYAIINNTPKKEILRFGLAQKRTFNGKSGSFPITVTTLFSDQKAKVTPKLSVCIFVHGGYKNGQIISNIDAVQSTFDFTHEKSIAVKYDGSRFIKCDFDETFIDSLKGSLELKNERKKLK